MAKSEWHYPRDAFARQVFDLLVESPSSAVSLFGPRRTGKTEFLQNDLAPYADDKKHRVVYASMWQTLDAPLATLLYAFDRALRGGKLPDRIASAARDLAPRLKLKPPAGAVELEIDTAALRGKPQDDHLLLLDQYCERLANRKRPTLLLFDEFQELARSDISAPLIAALRSSLDTRRGGLVSVFTGSSQDGLRQVFSAKDAPFYRFATQMTLPELDDAFVDHQLEVFKSKAKRKLDRADALRVFNTVERNPLFFQQWLIAMMAHAQLTPDSAVEFVLDSLGEQFSFDDIWNDLQPLQRAVMRLLAERVDRIYGEDSTRRMGRMTRSRRPGNAKVLGALRRLSRLGVAEKWDRDWRLNDPLLEIWVRSRPDGEFLELGAH